MTFSPTWIFTTAIFVGSFVAIVLMARFLTKPFDNIKFSFKRVFPFEAYKHIGSLEGTYRIILFLFTAMCFAPLFTLVNGSAKLQDLQPLAIITVCVYGLAGISFLFLHFFDATHVSAHIKTFVINIALVLLGNALTAANGFTRFKVCRDYGENHLVLAICGGFAALFALLVLLLAFNPKLMNWAKLEKVDGEENKYVRPMKFPLAYSEWATFLLLFLGELSFLLVLTIQ